MAGVHEVGEQIKLTVNTKVSSTLTDPSEANFPTVTIVGPTGTSVVAAVAMTKDSTGVFHYWWDSAGESPGLHTITYIADHTADSDVRRTIKRETIRLR